MNTLSGKTAIVTGASSGIGHATALLFAREGAKVVVSARRETELDALVAAIERAGGTAVAVSGDIRDEPVAQRLVDTAVERFGGLDIAFNNAGMVGPSRPVQDLATNDWHVVLDTNLTGAYLAAKYQVPALLRRGGGSLLFTSSFVGHTAGMPGMAAYAASKSGILGLVRCLAVEGGQGQAPAGAAPAITTRRPPFDRGVVAAHRSRLEKKHRMP